MPYVAHAGIQLSIDTSSYEKGKWYYIKTVDDIEYRWRFSKDLTFDVVAGVFDDKHKALHCAKQIYVTLFYTFVKGGFPIHDAGCSYYESRFFDKERDISEENYQNNELFFFWDKKYQGPTLGPGVFEVNSAIDEFDDYGLFSVKFGVPSYETDFDFSNVDDFLFVYCREAQDFFNTFLLAENTFDIGMQMTIYCGFLEHLSDSSLKEPAVLTIIDELIDHIDKSELVKKQKDSLKNYLSLGKYVSARKKCLDLCEKYAKTCYGRFSCKKIIDEAYSIRSAFSHGANCNSLDVKCSRYIKYVILDVILNYMREREEKNNEK